MLGISVMVVGIMGLIIVLILLIGIVMVFIRFGMAIPDHIAIIMFGPSSYLHLQFPFRVKVRLLLRKSSFGSTS